MAEIEGEEEITFRQYALLSREKEYQKKELVKAQNHLRICDFKKNLLASLCRHNEKGFCSIDKIDINGDMLQCRQQCTKPRAQIVLRTDGEHELIQQ